MTSHIFWTELGFLWLSNRKTLSLFVKNYRYQEVCLLLTRLFMFLVSSAIVIILMCIFSYILIKKIAQSPLSKFWCRAQLIYIELAICNYMMYVLQCQMTEIITSSRPNIFFTDRKMISIRIHSPDINRMFNFRLWFILSK